MSIIKLINRNFILPLIKVSHLSELIARYSSHNNLILNYHGVVKNYDSTLTKNHLQIDQFAFQMQYFKKQCHILNLEEIFNNKFDHNKKRNKKCIAITFDDGYLNNFENAFPILNSLNIPATIFVTAQSIFNPTLPLWYDLLDLLNSKLKWEKLKIEIELANIEGLNVTLHENYNSFKKYIKTTSPKIKIELVHTLMKNPKLESELSRCDTEYWKIMNKENLEEISKSNLIEIGSHGFTHSNLDQIEKSELTNELINSKNSLQESIGKKVESIAFPDGAYNQLVKEECHEIGYKRLLAVNYRCETDNNDPTILPRLSISNTTTSDAVIIQSNLSYSKTGF